MAAVRRWRWVGRRRAWRRGSAAGRAGPDNRWVVAGGGGGGEEKTARRQLGGTVAGSVREGGGGGAGAREAGEAWEAGGAALLRWDPIPIAAAMNTPPRHNP